MPELLLDDPHGAVAMIRESVASFAERFSGAAAMRDKRAAQGDLAKPIWSAMAEAGWTGLLLPDVLGGSGLGAAEQAVLSEALGRALITEPSAMCGVFPQMLLAAAPPSPCRDRLVAGLVSGESIVAAAWRGARGLVATSDSDGFIIRGEAHFVEAAMAATDMLVVASTGQGAVLLSAPADAAGLARTFRQGVDGSALATVNFSDVRANRSQVLQRATSRDALLDQPLLMARLALAAELAGLGCRALEITIEYAKTRVQFGKPIASFQVIQHRLVDMWSDAEFACAAVVNAVETLARGDVSASALAVLAAKARAGEAAFSICRRAIHIHGAMGIADESDIGLYLKRVLNLNATLGQPEELRLQFVARERAA